MTLSGGDAPAEPLNNDQDAAPKERRPPEKQAQVERVYYCFCPRFLGKGIQGFQVLGAARGSHETYFIEVGGSPVC